MTRRTRLIALVLLAATVSGCGPSIEGYVSNPEARRDILGKCASLQINPRTDKRCAMAAEAEARAAKETITGTVNK